MVIVRPYKVRTVNPKPQHSSQGYQTGKCKRFTGACLVSKHRSFTRFKVSWGVGGEGGGGGGGGARGGARGGEGGGVPKKVQGFISMKGGNA